MKIKFDSDDNLPLNKQLKFHNIVMTIRCDICHYWYFKDIGFKYEPYLCNGCHDLMQKAMGFNNIAIVYIKENAYRIHFWHMSKDDVINIMNDSILHYKRGIFL